MNAKKAKMYRALVRTLVKNGTIDGSVHAKYGQHRISGSIILDPASPKGFYRRLKKHGVERVLAGQA